MPELLLSYGEITVKTLGFGTILAKFSDGAIRHAVNFDLPSYRTKVEYCAGKKVCPG